METTVRLIASADSTPRARFPRAIAIALIGGFAFLNACTDSSRAVAPADRLLQSETQTESQIVVERPDEAEQLRIAREIPGFGGYFLDKAGQLVIRMSVAGAETRAKTRVLDLVRRERQQSHLGNAFQREPIIVASRFDLVHWRAGATVSLAQP